MSSQPQHASRTSLVLRPLLPDGAQLQKYRAAPNRTRSQTRMIPSRAAPGIPRFNDEEQRIIYRHHPERDARKAVNRFLLLDHLVGRTSMGLSARQVPKAFAIFM